MIARDLTYLIRYQILLFVSTFPRKLACNYFIPWIKNFNLECGLFLLYAIVQEGRQLDDSVIFIESGSVFLVDFSFFKILPLLTEDVLVSYSSRLLSLSCLFDSDSRTPLLPPPLAATLAVAARIATYVLLSSKGINAVFKLLKRAGIMISSCARRFFTRSRSFERSMRMIKIKDESKLFNEIS